MVPFLSFLFVYLPESAVAEQIPAFSVLTIPQIIFLFALEVIRAPLT